MKRLGLLLVLTIAMALTGCDECKDVACLNGGDCVEGDCQCPIGFSGDECEVEDKCITNDVDCENGGECDDGECDCAFGFTGEECEIFDRCATGTLQCQNDKPCQNNQCQCGQWYSGSTCGTWLLEDHIANYFGLWNCDGLEEVGTVSVTSNGSDNELQLAELEYDLTYTAVFTDSVFFTVPSQTIMSNGEEVVVSGDGNFKNNLLNYTMKYIYDDGTELNCYYSGD